MNEQTSIPFSSNIPLVSVVVTTYNRAWSIKRALQSVFDQTYTNWELIIIDDGSTDDTYSQIFPYLDDSRVTYIYQHNQGVGAAKNRGIEHISGELITFLDSDDELIPSALEIAVHKFQTYYPHYQQTTLSLACKTPEGEIIGKVPNSPTPITFQDVISGNGYPGEKFGIIKSDIFQNLQYRLPQKRGGVERMLWHKILKDGHVVVIDGLPVRIYYTNHNDRIKSSKNLIDRASVLPNLYEDYLNIFEEDYQRLAPEKLSRIYYKKGVSEILTNSPKEGRTSLKKSIQYGPSQKIKYVVAYISSFFPSKMLQVAAVQIHSIKNTLK